MTDLDILSDIELSFVEGGVEEGSGEVGHKKEFEGGFDGFMEAVALPDVIQLACLENKTRKLVISHEDDIGEIYLHDGEVIHASTKGLEGEEAFYKIMSWNEGSFRLMLTSECPRTIDVPWNFLLIEALRQRDEKKAHKLDDKGDSRSKILIVDDSKFFVSRLKELFQDAVSARIVGEAQNGKEALELLVRKAPDLITLDINMPVMAGDVALKHIMIRSPAPVVLVSNFSRRHCAKVMEFLRLGAVDFIAKPSAAGSWDDFSNRLELLAQKASRFQIRNIRRARNPRKPLDKRMPGMPADRLIVFLGGLGGLLEIQKILPNLRLGKKEGILILQDMCKDLIAPFAEYMDEFCTFSIKPLKRGAPILSNQAWVLNSKSTYMMRADETGAAIFEESKESKQDAIAELFSILSNLYQKDLIVVVLSGTDRSFLNNLYEVWKRGGMVICQQRESCLYPESLYGLKSLGFSYEEVIPENIPKMLNEIFKDRR